jgi:hypothetical protein
MASEEAEATAVAFRISLATKSSEMRRAFRPSHLIIAARKHDDGGASSTPGKDVGVEQTRCWSSIEGMLTERLSSWRSPDH